MLNFEINSKEIDKIEKISTEEKNFRIKNLELFKNIGFPNKRLEDWKFSDFKNIVDNNFNELDVKKVSNDISKIELYSLRRQIGIVPQEPLLFSGTVSENIAITNTEIG